MDFLKIIILLQMLFSFTITMIVYALPDDMLKGFMQQETRMPHAKSPSQIAQSFEKTTSSMKEAPLINIGALMFFTGIYLIDLFLNFIFAIPEMLTIPWNLFCYVFHIDPFYQSTISMVIFTISVVIYLIMIISLIVQIRSGRTIV